VPLPVVLLDANVLYPAPLRDFLLHLGIADAARLHWSERIQTEWTSNLIAQRPDLELARVQRTAAQMNLAFPDALVTGFESLEPTLALPDLDDRHVLAAAIKAGADVIVTKNLRDFPARVLGQFGIKALHPDKFIVGLLALEPERVLQALSAMQQSLKNPPKTMLEVLDTLEQQELAQSVAKLRILLG
jgi:predicted nucleic acid-binding protein